MSPSVFYISKKENNVWVEVFRIKGVYKRSDAIELVGGWGRLNKMFGEGNWRCFSDQALYAGLR